MSKARWRTTVHESSTYGRVLEAVLAGSANWQFWQEVRQVLHDEVGRQHPDYLVIDLRALKSGLEASFLGALVTGAVAMRGLGRPQGTRILAKGHLARELTRAIQITRLESALGVIYPDLESALAGPAPDER